MILDFLILTRRAPNGILPSNAYIKKLKKYLHEERVLKVNYCVKSNTVGGAVPVLSGNQKMKASAYIETIVEKKFIPVNEEIRIIIDTVTTYIETGKIGSIESSSSNGASDVDINKMRIKAAQLYQQENYNKAYELYEQIVKLDEKDAASLYYIGLMTYWQEGCKQQYSKKKKAKKAALDYLNRASYYSNSSQLSDKIEHALTVIKYNGDIPF